jgi:hypothetical protein
LQRRFNARRIVEGSDIHGDEAFLPQSPGGDVKREDQVARVPLEWLHGI